MDLVLDDTKVKALLRMPHLGAQEIVYLLMLSGIPEDKRPVRSFDPILEEAPEGEGL